MPDDRLDIIARALFTHLLTDEALRNRLESIQRDYDNDPEELAKLVNDTVGYPEPLKASEIPNFTARIAAINKGSSEKLGAMLAEHAMIAGSFPHN